MRTTHVPNVQQSLREASPAEAAGGRVIFTGNEQHEISLADAARLTRNFREHADRGAAKGGLVERAVIEKILAQENCIGIRLYHGLDARYQRMMVLVGVTERGTNLVHGFISAVRAFCAPFAGSRNILNLAPNIAGDTSEVHEGEFLPPRNGAITLAEAAELARRFRQHSEEGSLKAFFYGREIFIKVIGQPHCTGVRYYYGQQDTGEYCIVLVGVNTDGDDLIPGLIGDIGVPCPPICGGLDALAH